MLSLLISVVDVRAMQCDELAEGMSFTVPAVAGLLRDDDGVAAEPVQRRQDVLADVAGVQGERRLLFRLRFADDDHSDDGLEAVGDGGADRNLLCADLGGVGRRLQVHADEDLVVSTIRGEDGGADLEATVGLSSGLGSTRSLH